MTDHYKRDPSFAQAVGSAVSKEHPTPQAVIAAQASQNAQQIAQANPAQPQPWDNLSAKQKSDLAKTATVLDGIKQYRSYPVGMSIGLDRKPVSNRIYKLYSEQLDRQGGLSPEQATQWARYKMFLDNYNDIPTGERVQATDDHKAEQALKEGHFDALVGNNQNTGSIYPQPDVAQRQAEGGPQEQQTVDGPVPIQPPLLSPVPQELQSSQPSSPPQPIEQP